MLKSVLIYGEKGKHDNYSAALEAVGCRVCLSRDVSLSHAYEALLLPGGGDIFNRLDTDEHLLIQSFVDSARPILGICRGMQALNVWFGGTLHYHISGHQLPQGDMIHPTIAHGFMKELFGNTFTVNSNHHQAIAQLGQHLKPVQWGGDGIIEAICHDFLPIWGVQWHPERQSFALLRLDAADAAPLFRFFISQIK